MNDDLDRIEGLDRLARRRAPERDLWPGIAGRIAPRRSRWAYAQFALAASLVAGLAAVFTVSLIRTPAATPGATEVASYGGGMVLTDDSRAIVEANLSLVEQAARELRKALEEMPDSPTLRSMLASAENHERALRARL